MLSVRSSNSECAARGQRTTSCLSHAPAGDFSVDSREQNLNASPAFLFGLSRHPVAQFCQHANPALVNSHRTWSIPGSEFAVFRHENVCQSSSLQSKLRSIRARLSRLQTVIDHRSRLDTSVCTRRSGSSQSASDETLSRTACPGTELHCEPTRSVDQLCEMCPSPTVRSSIHCSDDVSVDPVIGFSAGGSETSVTPEGQRLHSESGEGHDCRSRGADASKEEGSTTTDDRVQHRVQFWSGIQCDDQLRELQCTEKSRRHHHLGSFR